ncbi:unnamed protein product, partial [Effrenium voratum]
MSAAFNAGSKYQCAVNFMWLDHFILASPHVPVNEDSVQGLIGQYFTKPSVIPADAPVHVVAGDVAKAEHAVEQKKLRILSPPEMVMAVLLQRDIKTSDMDVLHEWAEALAACPCVFHKIDNEDERHIASLQLRENISQNFASMRMSALQKVFDIQGLMAAKTSLTKEQVVAHYATVRYAKNSEPVKARFVDDALYVLKHALPNPKVQSIVLKMENYGPANPFDSVCKLQKIAKRAGGSKENLEWCFQILQDFWEAGCYAEDKFADRALDGKQPRCDGKGTVDLLVAKREVLVYLTGELLDSLFKDDDKAVIRNTCRCVESFREKCGYQCAPVGLQWKAGLAKPVDMMLQLIEVAVYSQDLDPAIFSGVRQRKDAKGIVETQPFSDKIEAVRRAIQEAQQPDRYSLAQAACPSEEAEDSEREADLDGNEPPSDLVREWQTLQGQKNIVDSYVTKCWNTLDTIVKLEVEPAEGLADFIQERLKGSACQAIRDKAKTDEAPSNSSSYAMLIYDMKSAGEASSHPSTRLPPLRQNGEHLKDFIRGSLAANVGHMKDDLADADLWVIPDGMSRPAEGRPPPLIFKDIMKRDDGQLPSAARELDLCTAGPPCQPYNHRKRQTPELHARKFLDFGHPLELILFHLNSLTEENGSQYYSVSYRVLDTSVTGGLPQARRRTYIAGWRRSAQQRPFQWPRSLPCMSLHEVLVEDAQSSTAVARAPTEAGQGRLKANMAKAARKIFKSTQSCAALQETSAAAGGLPPTRPAVSVYLCTSCLWRHEQLKIALVPNIAMISEHTAEVRWVIITAPGTGEEVTLQALQESLGDYHGAGHRGGSDASGPAGVEGLQQVRLTLGFVDTRATGGAFHMSFAKNASHMLGRKEAVSRAVNEGDASSVILVNLDCDNIIGPKFLPALLETFANPRLQILQARGYDEEPGVLGSGYQDIDFLKRVDAWASASATRRGGGGYRGSLQCGKGAAAAHDAVRFAIDNDLHNKARERGDAKLDHVSNEAKAPKADALAGLPRAPPPPLASGLAHLNKPIYVFSYDQAVVDRLLGVLGQSLLRQRRQEARDDSLRLADIMMEIAGLKTSVAQHPKWGDWIQSMAKILTRRLPASVSVAIGVFCNKGRHRSVSCVFLLALALRKLGFTHVLDLRLMAQLWQYGTRDNCQECRANYDAKLRLGDETASMLLRALQARAAVQ